MKVACSSSVHYLQLPLVLKVIFQGVIEVAVAFLLSGG